MFIQKFVKGTSNLNYKGGNDETLVTPSVIQKRLLVERYLEGTTF